MNNAYYTNKTSSVRLIHFKSRSRINLIKLKRKKEKTKPKNFFFQNS